MYPVVGGAESRDESGLYSRDNMTALLVFANDSDSGTYAPNHLFLEHFKAVTWTQADVDTFPENAAELRLRRSGIF